MDDLSPASTTTLLSFSWGGAPRTRSAPRKRQRGRANPTAPQVRSSEGT